MQVHSVAWDDSRAIALRQLMNTEMSVRYADRKVPTAALAVDHATVLWTGLAMTDDGVPAGHVALRGLDGGVEVKRMIVDPAFRGAGVARLLLEAAHAQARALGHRRVLLQTGDRQPDAVRVYERAGYTRVPIYPPYESVPFSICMVLDLQV